MKPLTQYCIKSIAFAAVLPQSSSAPLPQMMMVLSEQFTSQACSTQYCIKSSAVAQPTEAIYAIHPHRHRWLVSEQFTDAKLCARLELKCAKNDHMLE